MPDEKPEIPKPVAKKATKKISVKPKREAEYKAAQASKGKRLMEVAGRLNQCVKAKQLESGAYAVDMVKTVKDASGDLKNVTETTEMGAVEFAQGYEPAPGRPNYFQPKAS